jgi:hypothetical protein
MKVVFALILLCSIGSACSSTKNARRADQMSQGIKGYVSELVGNHMPSPDSPPIEPTRIKTRIYVYEATSLSQVKRSGTEPFYDEIRTKRVKTVMSDEDGFFAIELPAGRYSIFTKVDGRFYANTFDGNNIIAPVEVAGSGITELNIIISANATF